MKNTSSKSNKKHWRQDTDQWGIDCQWSGTAMIYVASGTDSFALSGDYDVSYEDESQPEDLRAARLFSASKGKNVPELAYDKLGDELVVVFGAKLTADRAIATLRSLIARIEDVGLMIGRVGTGKYVEEHVGKPLTVADARLFDIDE